MTTELNSKNNPQQDFNQSQHRDNQQSYNNLLSQIKQCVDKNNSVQGQNIILRSNYSREKTDIETNPEIKINEQNLNEYIINPWNLSNKNQIFENNLIINKIQNNDKKDCDKLFIDNRDYVNYATNNQNDELMLSNEERNNNYYNPFNYMLKSNNDRTKQDNNPFNNLNENINENKKNILNENKHFEIENKNIPGIVQNNYTKNNENNNQNDNNDIYENDEKLKNNNDIYENNDNKNNQENVSNNIYENNENKFKNEMFEDDNINNNEININNNKDSIKLNEGLKVNILLTSIPIKEEKKEFKNNQINNEEPKVTIVQNNEANIQESKNQLTENQNSENKNLNISNPNNSDIEYEEEENEENVNMIKQDNNENNNNNYNYVNNDQNNNIHIDSQNNNDVLYINNQIDPLNNCINNNGILTSFTLTAEPIEDKNEKKIIVNEIINNDNENNNNNYSIKNNSNQIGDNNNQIENETENNNNLGLSSDNTELDKNSVSTFDARKSIDYLSKRIKKFTPQLIILLLGGGLIYLLLKNQKIRDWLKGLFGGEMFMKIWGIIQGIFGFITPDIIDFLEKYSDIYRLLGLIVMIYILWFGFRIFLRMLSKIKKKYSK